MRALAVLALCGLAACGGDGGDPVVTGEDSTTTQVEAPPALAIDRCSELTEAAQRAVDGPVSPDPAIAAWQQGRADVGLPSDIDSTVAASSATASPDAEAWGWPMTDAELAEFLARSARGQAAAEAVRQLVESRPDYTIHGIDNATGGAFVGITGDTAALQAELDGAIGPGTVTVVGMTRTDDELRELSDQVGAYLERARQRSVGLGAGNRLGRLYVFLEILDPVLISELAAAFPDDVEAMCVEGADPADVVPDGPQPQQGDDWRLLADTPGVGAPYDTGFAGDAAGYEALWAEIGLPGEPPAVDFDTEAVIWFGPA